MYYSPGAQSSWESVYYLQYHVQGGWLLRAIHFYAGQAMLVLIAVYLAQMVIGGACSGRARVLYWSVLLMGLTALALNLTGDLLPWDQNSRWATNIRVAYLGHLPGVGPWLSKLAIGGTQFGTLTLTRFLALHAGVFTALLTGLIALHWWMAGRRSKEQGAGSAERGAGSGEHEVSYWPWQAWRDAAACMVVAAAIVGLSLRHGTRGPEAGIELGAPADLVDDPGTARPEWSFRGLYQLHETLARYNVPEAVSIFVIPGLTLLVFCAMPWIGRSGAGRVVNAVIVLGVLAALAGLTWQSYAHDAHDANYLAAVQAGQQEADRVKELVVQPRPEGLAKEQQAGDAPRIPASGARTLLRDDPKTQGPRIFNRQCASCHDYSGPAEYGVIRPEKGKATAADLNGFASQQWLSEFLTVKGISSDKFFGKTKFRRSKMYGFVKETFSDYDDGDKKQIIAALAHEAQLLRDKPAAGKDVTAGAKLISENCTECHTFHGKGTHSGPDLSGYGSREWLIGIISNPAHGRFYGKSNDRMLAFAQWPDHPRKNILSRHELELLVGWLRGEWYEPSR